MRRHGGFRVVRDVIRNPVVEYTYAKEDSVVASCDYGRVGAPLQESEGPRRTLSPSDRMAAERGKEDRGGVRGHRLQPGWVRKIARRYNEWGVEALGDR